MNQFDGHKRRQASRTGLEQIWLYLRNKGHNRTSLWGRLQVRPASCECAGCIILTDIVGYSRMNESRKAVTLEVNA